MDKTAHMKRKRTFAKTAAVLCAAVLSAYPISAEETLSANLSADIYSPYEYVRSTDGLLYDSSFAELVCKSAEKNLGERILYRGSLTESFADNLNERLAEIKSKSSEEGIYFIEANGKNVRIHGTKGEKVINIYADEKSGDLFYLDRNTLVSADPATMEKTTEYLNKKEYEDYFSRLAVNVNLSVYKLEKGMTHRFGYKGEFYTYEFFESYGGKVGLVFDSENTPVGLYNSNTGYMAIKLLLSPSDALFKVPSEYTEKVTAYSEAVNLTDCSYNAAFAQKLEELSEKSSERKVSYKNSRTKRFLGKILKVLQKINENDEKTVNAGYFFSSTGRNRVMAFGRKGEKALYLYADKYNDTGKYLQKESLTELSLSKREKQTLNIDEEYYLAELKYLTPRSVGGLSDELSADVFFLKYKGEKYICEMFSADGEKFGFLFGEKENLCGEYSTDEGYKSVRYVLSPNDSRFDVPENYSEAN